MDKNHPRTRYEVYYSEQFLFQSDKLLSQGTENGEETCKNIVQRY
jgi:hypothetical protein